MLVPYDPAWPELFDRMAGELRAAGEREWLIEHIGSTAVPGMTAKPIIDLAVRIPDAEALESHRADLARAGWISGSSVRTHPVLIREEAGVRTGIAHFFVATEWDAVNQRILRDWLLTHPDDVSAYERVKREAAVDASSYNAAKMHVIQEIVDRARAERGFPSVTVYDK